MSPAAPNQWWEQGLYKWQREALHGRQELTALRSQYQVLLLALQDLLAAVGGPDGTAFSRHRSRTGAPCRGQRLHAARAA